jgi:2-methylcitrate dehydratase PrpD
VCEPLAAKRRPQSDYDAKFSLPYAIASGLLRGRLGLQDLKPAAFTDPAALALMDRIGHEVDATSTFPLHYTGELRVTLDDGQVLMHREAVNRGHAERPLSNAEVRAKFFDNAAIHFPLAHAQAICDHVLALDELASVHTLESLLAHAPHSFN